MEAWILPNTPLADYLEGAGENEETWAIDDGAASEKAGTEDEREPSPPSSSSEDGKTTSFAPTALTVTPRARLRSLRPLKITHPNWYRKSRFNNVLAGGLNSRLSAGENMQFLERYRYVIVASQLLNEHVNHTVNYDTGKEPTSPLQKAQNELSKAPLLIWFGYPSPQFWTTGAACVLVMAVLLAWVLKDGPRRPQLNKGKAAVALVLSMMVAIFLFAHARRRWLRSVRSRAFEATTRFIENCQIFDMVTSNAITMIQEIELVSRGYRLSAPLPPITRLERNGQRRRCERLRRAVLSALMVSLPPQTRAIEALRTFAKEVELEKFYDVYDIQVEDLHEMGNAGFGFDDGEFEDMESLKTLKALFHRIYNQRKVLLCSLLSMEARGGREDHEQWKAVAGQLELLGGLMANSAEEIRSIIMDDEDIDLPPTSKVPNSPGRERLRGQLRKLNTLSTSIRGLQAKMHVLREESGRAFREGENISDFGPELLAQYDSIGADLHTLVSEWDNSRTLLALALDKHADGEQSYLAALRSPTGMSTAGTLVDDDETKEHRMSGAWADGPSSEPLSPLDFDRKRMSMASTVVNVSERPSDEEELFEAVANPKPRSTLTREKRILKVQEERSRAAAARQKAEASVNMVKELQTVLGNRPARRSLLRGGSIDAKIAAADFTSTNHRSVSST